MRALLSRLATTETSPATDVAGALQPSSAGRLHGAMRYWLLIMPALLLMLAFYLYPIGRVLWISVTEPKPGLDNFALLATSASIHKMLVTTARISILTTIITLVLAYLVAYT